MAEIPHQDPVAGFRALLLAQTDSEIGPLGEENVGGWPDQGLLEKLDYVSVDLIDGDQNYFEQTAYLQVDVFSATRAKAKSLSAAISMLVVGYPEGVPLEGRVFQIDRGVCISSPRNAEWEDTKIRRQSARYEISVRR